MVICVRSSNSFGGSMFALFKIIKLQPLLWLLYQK
eukprot:UN13171